MAINKLILIGALFGILPFGYRASTIRVYEEHGWRLVVTTYRFSRVVDCTIENRSGFHPDVELEHGLLEFRFDRKADAYAAWYAIDGGQPRSWSEVRSRLVHTGAMAAAERLDNATDGRIPFSLSDVLDARAITIQADPSSRPRTFTLRSLWPIVRSAKALGCFDDAAPTT